jgi:SPX domain protein involved in polyphosphate accumulation
VDPINNSHAGFGKILKKYEKVTGERVRRSFMQRLDQEDFFKSGDLGAIIQLVETLFYVVSDGRRLSEVSLSPFSCLYHLEYFV